MSPITLASGGSSCSRSHESSRGRLHHQDKTCVIVVHGEGIAIVRTIIVNLSPGVATINYTTILVSANHACSVSLPLLEQGKGPNSSVRVSFRPVEKQLSTVFLSIICNVNKNLLQVVGIIKPRVLLRHTQVKLKFIVCETLTPSAIIKADSTISM